MKVNEIVIVEGFWADLQAQGRKNQQELWKDIKTGVGDLNPLGPVMQSLQKKLAAKVQAADTDKLVDAWVKEWQKEYEKAAKSLPEPPAGTPPDDVTKKKTAQYQGLFRSWLEKITKVNVDLNKLKLDIPVIDDTTNFDKVRNYLKTHFIPGYMKAQADPMQAIPDGTTVPGWSKVGPTGRPKSSTYRWNEAEGRFIETTRNEEVPTYTDLHKELLQQAMLKAARSSGAPTLAGGGSAITI